jgi:hypothetical protein
MVNKDQSIVMQVAAKIAAELTPKSDDVNANIVSFATAFDAVKDLMFTEHGFTGEAIITPEQAVANVQQAFPNATVTTSGGMSVRIKGKQHGPIPEWLVTACASKGISEVWDNRDGLSANPKRPWFKSTTTDDAFWAPRGK